MMYLRIPYSDVRFGDLSQPRGRSPNIEFPGSSLHRNKHHSHKHKRESIHCHHHTIAMNTIAIAIAVIITTTASRSRRSNSTKHNACASCDQSACDRWLLCFTDMDSRSNLLQAVGRDPVMSKQASILPAQMQMGMSAKMQITVGPVVTLQSRLMSMSNMTCALNRGQQIAHAADVSIAVEF